MGLFASTYPTPSYNEIQAEHLNVILTSRFHEPCRKCLILLVTSLVSVLRALEAVAILDQLHLATIRPSRFPGLTITSLSVIVGLMAFHAELKSSVLQVEQQTF